MILIRSEKQAETSRKNGALSRGPVTEKGKRRSSRNALRHGLFSKSIVLGNERKQNFTFLNQQYREHFQPKDTFEEGFVEEMAAAFWRMRRISAMQTSALNEAMPEPEPVAPGEPADDDFNVEIKRSTESFFALAEKRSFTLLLRYEDELHRKFHRALRGILQVQGQEKK